MQEFAIFVMKSLKINILKTENIVKLEIIAIIQMNRGVLHCCADYTMCNLKYSIPKEIRIICHNGSNYDYYFIIKKLAETFEGQFNF